MTHPHLSLRHLGKKIVIEYESDDLEDSGKMTRETSVIGSLDLTNPNMAAITGRLYKGGNDVDEVEITTFIPYSRILEIEVAEVW